MSMSLMTVYVAVFVALLVMISMPTEVLGDGGTVHVLTSENWEDEMERGVWAVKFYGPKCGHCKDLAPNWQKLADRVAAEGLNLFIGKYDATEDASIPRRLNGYPWPSIKVIGKFGRKVKHMEDSREQHREGGVDNILAFVRQYFGDQIDRKAEL